MAIEILDIIKTINYVGKDKENKEKRTRKRYYSILKLLDLILHFFFFDFLENKRYITMVI